MSSSKLIDHLIQVQNLSGAIRNAPHSLKNLKESIDGVPFQLLVPGMSGVMGNFQKIFQAISQLTGQLGGLGNVGNFTNILGSFSGMTGLTGNGLNGIASLGSNLIGTRINIDQIIGAMGNVGSFGAALSQYAPLPNIQNVNVLAGLNPNANLDGVTGGANNDVNPLGPFTTSV